MANYNEKNWDDNRSSEDNNDRQRRRSSYQEPDYGTYGASNTGNSQRGYSNYGNDYDAYRRRNEQDWRNRGMAGGNFSGSNEDRDFEFGMNRRGTGNASFGQYTSRDNYSNRDDVNSPLGVRSNYAYNRAGFGSNYGGEYGHTARNDREYSNEFGGPSYSREHGWAWGNPDREYSSYNRRFDREQEERWERDNYDWIDRAGDTVKSWFGNEEADRRLRVDKWKSRHQEQTPTYRGMGPKSYQRTDARIEEDVNDRLSDDAWVDASDIEVKVERGEVVLTGTVNDKNAKRRAEDIAETVYGVSNVENRIRVNRSYPSSNDRSWL